MSYCQAADLTERLHPLAGTYALILGCKQPGIIKVGKLGMFELCRGYYLYIGSALGPGGIRARITHHLRPTSSPHWHIDYLKAHCRIRELWVKYSTVRYEQRWVETIGQHPDMNVPLPGFGASDSRTFSHLFQCRKLPTVGVLGAEVDPEIVRLARILHQDGVCYS